MKTTILFLTLAVFCQVAFAQDDEDKVFKFGVGGTISVPLGDLKESTTYGVGFEVTGVYSITENIAAFAQTGINVFKGQSNYGYDDASLLNIPFLAGARFKTGGFFIGAGAGYGRFTSDGTTLSGFMYSPQVGYDLGKMQVLLHYSATSVTGGTLSYVGLKAFRTF